MTTDTPRKVKLESSDWMLAALKMNCVCDVIGHKCIDCTVHDYLVRLERTLSEREGQLRECVELLTTVRKKLCYGDGDPWRRKVDALLARLKEAT